MNLLSRAILALALVASATTAVGAAGEAPTVITSERGDMVSTPTETTFTFEKNVKVTGTNLTITCDRLVVVATRIGDPKATLGTQDKFKSLVATGHVHIVQNDREAFCGRAEVLPGEDKVVLTENPRVLTSDGTYEADGPIMELFRGQRRAAISGGVHIALPPLKDLGYDKEPEKGAPAQHGSASTDSTQPPQK